MKKMNNKSALLAIVLAVCFAVSLVPMLIASFYTHPMLDDLGYSLNVHRAAMAKDGLFSILGAAIGKAMDSYVTWQGTFSAIFIFALQPGAFGDDLYFLTTFIMLGALIGATVFLMDTILVKWLGQRRSHMWILSLATLFIQIQFAPDIAEGFFWFNGSSYYTLFYALDMVLAALLVRLVLADQRSEKYLTAGAALLAAFIGGGNYNTGLFTGCLLVLVIMVLMAQKNSKYKNVIVVFLAFGMTFAINMAAPGNAVRASAVTQMEPVQAVLMSLHHAVKDLEEWTTIEKMAVVLFVTPVLYKAAKNCSWTFRHPVLVIIVAFGLYACQKTPVLYAMSYEGAGRQLNIFYYSYVLFLLFVVFYISGWIEKNFNGAISIDKVFRSIREKLIPLLIVFAMVFVYGCVRRNIGNMTSVQCAVWLSNGYCQMYDKELTERIELLKATDGDCYITALEHCPRIFVNLELGESDFWVNQQWADYYECESVHFITKANEKSLDVSQE